MFEERDTKAPQQGEFRMVRDNLLGATAGAFYRKLEDTLRAFLGYDLTETISDHSSLPAIRTRLGVEVLDQSRVGRAPLKGAENLTTRLTAAALPYDLSLLIRKFFGFETSKQWVAKARGFVWRFLKTVVEVDGIDTTAIGNLPKIARRNFRYSREILQIPAAINARWCFSSGC